MSTTAPDYIDVVNALSDRQLLGNVWDLAHGLGLGFCGNSDTVRSGGTFAKLAPLGEEARVARVTPLSTGKYLVEYGDVVIPTPGTPQWTEVKKLADDIDDLDTSTLGGFAALADSCIANHGLIPDGGTQVDKEDDKALAKALRDALRQTV